MAVSAPIRRVILTANESKKKISQGRDAIKSVGQVILKRTKVKREAFAQTNIFKKRREESEKRMMLEDELEASRIVTTPKGPQQLVQATGIRGFFDRILGFIGYLAAGWIMNNLPTWIAMGKEFVARLQRAGEIVSGFFNNTIKLFTNVGNILGALGQNLMQFDFFDTSNRVKNAMGELNNTMGNLTGQIEEAFDLLTTPLTEGKYSGEEIPETGTQQTDQGAYTEPPPYSGSGGGTKYPQLAATIVKGEGGLNSVNRGNAGDTPGGAKSIFGKNLTDMTIGEIMQAQKEGRVFAVGKYQFIPGTLAGAVKHTKVPLNAKFDKNTQDRLFDYLVEVKRPIVGQYLSGKSNNRREAIQELAREFASVGLEYPESGRRRGQSRYSGLAGNTASISPDSIGNVLDSQRRAGPSQISSQSQQPRQESVAQGRFSPLTGTSGQSMGNKPLSTPTSPFMAKTGPITSGFGYRWGKMHKGYDIGVPVGTPVYAYLPGTVTKIGYDSGGYGYYIEWKDSIHSQIHFFGHLKQKPSMREGQSFETGALLGLTGNTGRSTAPHLHWEIGPQGAQVDPGKWLRSVGSKQLPVSPASAQIAAPAQQTNTVPFSLTPERKGQDIIIIDQPRQQQNIITPASGGGGQGPSAISDFDLLNNFIKNKLLLDLAYV